LSTRSDFLQSARARLATLAGEFPFEPRALELDAGRMHYVDEGPRAAAPIVCVHGNPTWSFYFRRIVREFSPAHRVVAMDHLGCGLSDKPKAWSYRLADHAENLCALLAELELRDVTLVMHDWGGAIGMAAARRAPERIARLFITNSAAFRSSWMPARIRACRIPLLGPYLITHWNAFAGLAPRMAMHAPERLSDVARRGLLLPYDTPEHRIAIRRFVEDIPMRPSHPSWSELVRTEEALARFRELPTAIAWGERDWCFTPRLREEWQRRFPDARVTRIEHAGHYVFEEAPSEIETALSELLAVRACAVSS
jgi:pimeloyl-ACP methyl ester carboxylesterase